MIDDKTRFLGWYDITKPARRSLGAKMEAACERFTEKFGGEVNTILCNAGQLAEEPYERAGTEIRGVTYIARHTVYVGRRV